jgi:hypothetical protein
MPLQVVAAWRTQQQQNYLSAPQRSCGMMQDVKPYQAMPTTVLPSFACLK